MIPAGSGVPPPAPVPPLAERIARPARRARCSGSSTCRIPSAGTSRCSRSGAERLAAGGRALPRLLGREAAWHLLVLHAGRPALRLQRAGHPPLRAAVDDGLRGDPARDAPPPLGAGAGRDPRAAVRVGAYYAGATEYYLTQVEGLVGFPLYLTLWFATRGADEEPRAWRAFVSGLCGAVVLLFKLVFLPLVGGVLAAGARGRGAAAWRGPRAGRGGASRGPRPRPAARGRPRATSRGSSAGHADLDVLHLPRLPPGADPRRPGGAARGRVAALPAALRAPVGLATVGAGATGGRRDSLGIGLVVWLAVGLPVILVQRWSGWPYHELLLLAPLGVLAAAGVGALASFLDRPGAEGRAARRLAAAGLAALFAGLIGFAAMKGVQLARGAVRAHGGRPRHLPAAGERALSGHLPGRGAPGRAGAAAGDDLHHRESDRLPPRRARPRAGVPGRALPEAMGAAEWAALTKRLVCAPPAFILVEWRYVPLITGSAPRAASLAGYLAAGYRVAFTTERGAWYERAR